MTDALNNQGENIHDRADDGSGNLGSVSEIYDNLHAELATLGAVYTDANDIPSTANARAHEFSSVDDLFDYLQQGGLVHYEESGGRQQTIPNGIVHILRQLDEFSDDEVYYVWIDDDTG